MKHAAILPALSIICLAFTQCHSQKTTFEKLPQTSSEIVNSTYPAERYERGVVRLIEGENKFLEEHQLNLTFTKALQDSRCPMNARCITAGNATIEFEVMSTSSRPKKFQVSVGDLRGGKIKSVDFGNVRITLANLYPSNSTDVDFAKLKGKYVADFTVEKLTN